MSIDKPPFDPPSQPGQTPLQPPSQVAPPADGQALPPGGQAPAPWQPPPPGSQRVRPWWGLGDVLLGVPVIIVAVLLGSLLSLPFTDMDALLSGEEVTTPLAMLAISLVAQQLGQGLWPIVVSRWKGLGAAADWRLRFHWSDLAIGLGTAIIMIGLSALAGAVVAEAVGLSDPAEADNTQFLRDADGTVWLYVLLAAVVIGAPLAEELFFRGLVLRALEKRWGTGVAIGGSALIFTLPHFVGAGLAGTAVLFASIGVVGLVLAAVVVSVDRLAPVIVAHVLYNIVGAAGALGAFDSVPT